MGGIASSEDAIEFLLAGASAVAVGTANFVNPAIAKEVADGIQEYLKDHQLSNVKELVGQLKVNK